MRFWKSLIFQGFFVTCRQFMSMSSMKNGKAGRRQWNFAKWIQTGVSNKRWSVDGRPIDQRGAAVRLKAHGLAVFEPHLGHS
jgi:hypothetical protein